MWMKFERVALPGEWYRRVHVNEHGYETRTVGNLWRPVRTCEPMASGLRIEADIEGRLVVLVAMTSRDESELFT
jgi:hypothetical protein